MQEALRMMEDDNVIIKSEQKSGEALYHAPKAHIDQYNQLQMKEFLEQEAARGSLVTIEIPKDQIQDPIPSRPTSYVGTIPVNGLTSCVVEQEDTKDDERRSLYQMSSIVDFDKLKTNQTPTKLGMKKESIEISSNTTPTKTANTNIDTVSKHASATKTEFNSGSTSMQSPGKHFDRLKHLKGILGSKNVDFREKALHRINSDLSMQERIRDRVLKRIAHNTLKALRILNQ